MEWNVTFMGPVGSGKTTAIRTISDIEVVNTDARATDEVARMKSTTTVSMDVGVLMLGDKDKLRLYGTPGQDRFDFMWDILTENALGLVLMIKGNAPDPVADLRTYVEEFRDFIDQSTLVVGITHTDEAGGWQVRQNLARELDKMGLPPVVMDADARSRPHMATLVQALIFGIDPMAGA